MHCVIMNVPMNFARFKKPSRYIGSEINVIRKDSEIKTALCFPDTYEVGMSHTGLKILYAIINNIHYASAERVMLHGLISNLTSETINYCSHHWKTRGPERF